MSATAPSLDSLQRLPGTLIDAIAVKFKINGTRTEKCKGIGKLLSGASATFGDLVKFLSKKTLLTMDMNTIYSFVNSRWAGFTFSPTIYRYFAKSWKKSPAINLKLIYLVGQNKTENARNFNRSLISFALGVNFPVKLDRGGAPSIEIKPGLKATDILRGVYTQESKYTFMPTVTFRAKI